MQHGRAHASNQDVLKPSTGIKALPPRTIRQISSSQVLIDPSSVVKELIDNALDARATAIFVDIAANALDSIQVKDNGHGIPVQDRALVCRRHCTSKLHDFHNLTEVCGKWLGFRGEALASMASMSGSLAVFTRVEGEPVAVLLKFDQKGEVASIERASHPVGTTVKVTDFFKPIPVRNQEALKHSARFLVQIRRLMQAYALAQPTVRFQLRVLKAKTDKGNFIYAPKTGGNTEDAALKVIGRDCALQCDWSAIESNGFEVHAFLPKLDAAAAKISNEGAFISVDSRPLASSRGTPKKIAALLKSSLRRANPALVSVKNPFFFMNIICPPNSYDPNIEPAKDDVLFEDLEMVLGIVERLLRAFYPENVNNILTNEVQILPSTHTPQNASPSPFKIHENEDEHKTSAPLLLSSSRNEGQQWRTNMYGVDEEDLHLLPDVQPLVLEEEEGSQDVVVSNPWTIAKMNSLVKPQKHTGNPQLPTSGEGSGKITTASSSPMSTPPWKLSLTTWPLTPQTFSQLSTQGGSLNDQQESSVQLVPRPRGRTPGHQVSRCEDIDLPIHPTQFRESSDSVCGLNTTSSTLNQQTKRQSQFSVIPRLLPLEKPQRNLVHMVSGAPEVTVAPHRSQQKENPIQKKVFKSSASVSEGLWLSQPIRGPPGLSEQSASPRRKKASRHTEQQRPTDSTIPKGPRINALGSTGHLHVHITSENNPDGVDFFRRNKVQRQPTSMELALSPYIEFSPVKPWPKDRRGHGNISEQLRARTPLEAPSRRPSLRPLSAPESDAGVPLQDISSIGNATPGPSHPRRRSTASHLRRPEFSRLPLEHTLSNCSTQNIILSLSFSVAQLETFSRKMNMSVNSLEWGCPPEEAYDLFATPVTDEKVMGWAKKIDRMLDVWFEREKDAKTVVGIVADMVQETLLRRCKEDEEMLPA